MAALTLHGLVILFYGCQYTTANEDMRFARVTNWVDRRCYEQTIFHFLSLSHYGLSDHSPDSRTACTALQCAPSIPFITALIYGYTRSWHSIALRRTGY